MSAVASFSEALMLCRKILDNFVLQAMHNFAILTYILVPRVHFEKYKAVVIISIVRSAPSYSGLSRSTGPRAAASASLQLWQPFGPADWGED